MPDIPETTLLVLSESPVDVRVASALQSAAQALGYAEGCAILQTDDIPDLKRFVFAVDPWAVMAIDEASIETLRAAFSLTQAEFAPDVPACVAGYALVAVPAFSGCLDDPASKRVAWGRMHAAAHPENPLG